MSSKEPWSKAHLDWLLDTGERPVTQDDKLVEIWEIFPDMGNGEVLSLWARHIRNHYCSDNEIDELRHGTGLSRADYLLNVQFPDASAAPGPSIRSGDFAEILIADQLEFVQSYWVPRVRYCRKASRNESVKGCDLIGFRTNNDNDGGAIDELIIVEVKAMLSSVSKTHPLQDAIRDSRKDEIRKAESLNAMRQRFLDTNDVEEADRIMRFQNPIDNPYLERSGAAAVVSTELFDSTSVAECDTHEHPNHAQLRLLIIHGSTLMQLVHGIYARAANEA